MKRKTKSRRISWMLIMFLVAGIFSGFQPLGVQKVMAATLGGLKQVNQNNEEINFQVLNDSGRLRISNNAISGGFASSGITNSSYLITEDKISGDFSVEADILVVNQTNTGTGGVIGVGAFGGTGDKDLLITAVARGNDSSGSYYQKTASTDYSYGSPKGTTTTGSAIRLKVERKTNKYTVTVNGDSKDITSSVNSESLTSDMHLGLVICGAEAEVETLAIKQGENIIFDLNAPSTEEPSGPAPTPSGVEATLNSDSVDIAWEGEDLVKGTSYQVAVSKDQGEYTPVKSYTYDDFTNKQDFEIKYPLTASGSYLFQVTGVSGINKSEPIQTTTAILYIMTLAKPELTVSQDSGIVFLKWTPVKEAESYDVEVMGKDGSILSDKSIRNINTTSVQVTNFDNGESYTFKVTAKRGEESVASDVSAPLT